MLSEPELTAFPFRAGRLAGCGPRGAWGRAKRRASLCRDAAREAAVQPRRPRQIDARPRGPASDGAAEGVHDPRLHDTAPPLVAGLQLLPGAWHHLGRTALGRSRRSWLAGWAADPWKRRLACPCGRSGKHRQYRTYGGPEVLEWAEALTRTRVLGSLIAVRAASVNPIDWKAFSGAMSGGEPMAGTGYLGVDAAGVVDEVGEGVTGVSLGDEVFGRGRNTQAEYAVLDAWAPSRRRSTGRSPPRPAWPARPAERGLRLLDVTTGDTLFVDGGARWRGRPPCRWRWPGARRWSPRPARPTMTTCGRSGRPRCCTARAWLSGSGPLLAGRSTSLMLRGKTPVEELVSLAPEPSQVVSVANFAAGQAGARVTGGGADSRPMEALALVAELLAQNKLVLKVQTFPFDRAAEAYRISQGGHVRGKLVLVP